MEIPLLLVPIFSWKWKTGIPNVTQFVNTKQRLSQVNLTTGFYSLCYIPLLRSWITFWRYSLGFRVGCLDPQAHLPSPLRPEPAPASQPDQGSPPVSQNCLFWPIHAARMWTSCMVGTILLSLGCYNKLPYTGWLVNNKNVFFQFWR